MNAHARVLGKLYCLAHLLIKPDKAKPYKMFDFDLRQDILSFLQQQPLSKEVAIIRHLQDKGRIPADALQTDLGLFRCHFLVFHALYRLQQQGFTQRAFKLTISSLYIEYDDAFVFCANDSEKKSEKSIERNDPLAAFYLDLRQLNQTDNHDVQQLLNRFWQRLITPHAQLDREKQDALAVLELEGSVDFTTIKQQYRRLAMQHHPDRGGDQEKLVAINQAMQCLEAHYST